ncbi:RNA 2'-phosphotransferase [Salmonella enterica]|nr:RNA 2'-phosphotransferase [Salmonella enterica]
MSYKEKIPPDFLYHGTTIRFLEILKEQGLVAGSRQYVHLSSDETTAIAVGKRHGKPCVFKIKNLLMYKRGIKNPLFLPYISLFIIFLFIGQNILNV